MQIPDHTLLRLVGEGAYGEVWLARNSMGLLRAVKIVRHKRREGKSGFERELAGIKRFEPISRSHEGFVDILHVGINESAGYFYYVMELGDDELLGPEIDPNTYSPKTLGTEIQRRGRLPAEECLQIGIDLSSALAALHKNELIHRDIKPSNIIFVGGIPKLADIGLVADFSEARSFVGTEGFIPPEGPGKAGADIFALGKVLYEAVTGLDRNHFPSLPQDFDQAPDIELFGELNEVILQACQVEPAKRYSSASKMHDELLFLTNGKSVKRLRLLEKRFTSLKRTGILAGATLVVAGILAFPVYREWKYRLEIRQQKIDGNLANGNKAVNSGDLMRALPFYVEAQELDKGNGAQITNHRFRVASILALCPKLTHFWSCSNEIGSCEFSPDGKFLLVAAKGQRPCLYDLQSRKVNDLNLSCGYLMMASFSPTGQYFVAADYAGFARVCEWPTGREISVLPHTNGVIDARFSPDGRQIVTGCQNGSALIWDWRTTNTLNFIYASAQLRTVAFSPDGKQIVTGAHNGDVQLWDAGSGTLLRGPFQHPTIVSSVSFSPDGKILVTGCADFNVRVWDLQAGKLINPVLNHRDLVSTVQCSADGRFILTSGWDGTARVWRADTLQEIPANSEFHHPDRVLGASFSRDCRLIATATVDGAIRIWDLAGENIPERIDPVLFSPDGSRCVQRHGSSIDILNAGTWQRTAGPLEPKGMMHRWGLNSDGTIAFALSWVTNAKNESNNVASIWRVRNGSPAAQEFQLGTNVFGLAINVDGSFVASLRPDLPEWRNLLNGKRGSLPYDRRVNRYAFSSRADTFAALLGTNVDVYRIDSTPHRMYRLSHITSASAAQFNADASLIATACSDGNSTKCYAQVWDVGSGKPIGPQLKHTDGVLTVMFSPDGQRLVTASEDFTSVVWDFRTGKVFGSSMDHIAQAHHAVFSSDGARVATVGADHIARVWDSDAAMPLTPQIRFPMNLNEVHFCDHDRKLIVIANQVDAWSFSLPSLGFFDKDLETLAGVLSSLNLAQIDHMRGQARMNVLQEWSGLRAKYPSQFEVSDADIARWHRMQAELSESSKFWGSAIFHWNILLEMYPTDQQTKRRLVVAKNHLAAEARPQSVVNR